MNIASMKSMELSLKFLFLCWIILERRLDCLWFKKKKKKKKLFEINVKKHAIKCVFACFHI